AQRLVAGEALLPAEEVVDLLRIAGQSRERDREVQRSIERLTPREREVLQALADGLSDREISENLHVGIGTVRNHLVSVFAKLGVNSRLQALVIALRHGIVEVGRPS
ncbi:MAG: response regulator transcription factor, partial [Actinomycetota bacterium]|nr:response regulator transcription factor [Actinomycetota bacterium]